MIQNAPWFTREIADGVIAKSCQFDNLPLDTRFSSNRQVIYIVQADMNTAGLIPRIPFLNNGARKTISSFATETTGAVACINGSFCDPDGYSVQYLKVEGELITPVRDATIQNDGGIAIDAAGDLRAIKRPAATNRFWWDTLADPNVMSTNICVVSTGTAVSFNPSDAFYQTDRQPRTAIGETADNKLLMVVVDGRSGIASGMTFVELGRLMLALNARNAVALDGGGSSTMWDWNTPGYGVSNNPSDGAQRPVGNAVALVAPGIPPSLPYDARRAEVASHVSPYASPHAFVSASLEPGETKPVSFSFVNYGTTTWTQTNIKLSTTEPRGHAGAFLTSGDWLSSSVPTLLDQASVAPGETGTFTFTVTAPAAGETTTAIESYGLVTSDNEYFGPEQNRVYILVQVPTSGETIVESRTPDGSLNTEGYTEAGSFSNTSSKSTVIGPPTVYGNGARYSVTPGDSVTFTPDLPASGLYSVYVTMGSGSNNSANTTYTIHHNSTQTTGSVNLTFTDSSLANNWKLLASGLPFAAGEGGSITFNNVDGNNASGKRFVADAVRFSTAPAALRIGIAETSDSFTGVLGLASFLSDEGRAYTDFSSSFESGIVPDLSDFDLLIIGSFLTNDSQKKTTYLNSAGTLASFVNGGGTVTVLCQADQNLNSETWMPAPRTLQRSDPDYGTVQAFRPSHILLTTPQAITASDLTGWRVPSTWSTNNTAWEAVTGFNAGSAVLGPNLSNPFLCCLLEMGWGGGRALFYQMALDKAYAAGNTVSRNAAHKLLRNMLAYAELVNAGTAPPIEFLSRVENSLDY